MTLEKCILLIIGFMMAALPSSRAASLLLSGHVENESGSDIKGTLVALEPLHGGARLATTTGQDGVFQFDNVLAGTYSLSAYEQNYVFTVYAPVVVASKPMNLNIRLDRLPNGGLDLFTCDMSLVRGQVTGRPERVTADTQFCMSEGNDKRCTHLGAGGSYALYVTPRKYELSLITGSERLASQAIDATYCGEYKTKIVLLE
jgi:hypothetical protein